MTTGRSKASLVPSSIADARGRAFGAMMERALADPEFKRLLFERIDTVDAAILPFLVREFSIEEFIEPGMSDVIIRRLLKGSYALHQRKGYRDGVRVGLAMLGVTIPTWIQWFQENPKAAPGTHKITLAINDVVFEQDGRAITARLQRAITRMIGGMTRHSQDIAARVSTESTTPMRVGMAVIHRISVRPSTEPITRLTGIAGIFTGAAVSTRLRIAPQV